jgi:hypothetical protein
LMEILEWSWDYLFPICDYVRMDIATMHVCTKTHTQINMDMCTETNVSIYTYTRSYTRAYTHTYIHTYIHVYKHT